VDDGQFNINVVNTTTPTDKGRVRYTTTTTNFAIQSDTYTAIVTVTGTDAKGHTTSKADVTANGEANGQSAFIQAHAEDNGEPNAGGEIHHLRLHGQYDDDADLFGRPQRRERANSGPPDELVTPSTTKHPRKRAGQPALFLVRRH